MAIPEEPPDGGLHPLTFGSLRSEPAACAAGVNLVEVKAWRSEGAITSGDVWGRAASVSLAARGF